VQGWYTECEPNARVSSYCNSDEESFLKRPNFSDYTRDPRANKVLRGIGKGSPTVVRMRKMSHDYSASPARYT